MYVTSRVRGNDIPLKHGCVARCLDVVVRLDQRHVTDKARFTTARGDHPTDSWPVGLLVLFNHVVVALFFLFAIFERMKCCH